MVFLPIIYGVWKTFTPLFQFLTHWVKNCLGRITAYLSKFQTLKNAIFTHLQDFLLELGNGFSFVARQKRIVLDGDEFKIDLVFYNRLLQCFVIFDLKIDKITHQDLGQLQMYVNYYDRDIKMDYENPTIGVLLCG